MSDQPMVQHHKKKINLKFTQHSTVFPFYTIVTINDETDNNLTRKNSIYLLYFLKSFAEQLTAYLWAVD